jgi:hypothetical protein
MKSELYRVLVLAGIALLTVPAMGVAEVRRIEIDVTGYLCGM